MRVCRRDEQRVWPMPPSELSPPSLPKNGNKVVEEVKEVKAGGLLRKILCNLLFMGRGFSFHGGRWVFFLMRQSLYQPPDKCQSKASSPALSGRGVGFGVWGTTPEDLGDNRTMSLTCYTVSVWSPHRLAQALFGTRLIAARNIHIHTFFFFFSGRLICPTASSWAGGRRWAEGVSPD